MTGPGWRELSDSERALTVAWLDSWNARTRDTATLVDDARARTSCGCGTCPTFAVRPVVLNQRFEREDDPYVGEGSVLGGDGVEKAGILVWGFREHLAGDEIEFEIYPLDDEPVHLKDVRVTFA